MRELTQEFWDALDETRQQRAGGKILGVRQARRPPRRGEVEQGSGRAEFRTRFPRLERAQNLTAILAHLIEREERMQ
jgi:hypothetical protein